MIRRAALTILYLGLAGSAFADEAVECAGHGFSNNCGLLQKVVWVTKEDHRRTISQYAKDKGVSEATMEQRFRATGHLNCKGHASTAQLTGNENVITTAGHEFFNGDCSANEPKACYFVLNDDPQAVKYQLDAASLKTPGCALIDRTKDWATVKLTSFVPGVKAYSIPQSNPAFANDQPIIQVSARHHNFKVNGIYPKTIEDCFIRVVNLSKEHPLPLKTDCNSGLWSSGSAQIGLVNGKTVIVALHVAGRQASSEGSGFDSEQLYNVSVPMSGDFLAAVKENLGEADNFGEEVR